jgi:hypothetical protein
MLRHIATAFIALVIATAGLEIADSFHRTGQLGFVTPAEAIVGRPVTPVSVAGVTRRTVRRCAVDVYDC